MKVLENRQNMQKDEKQKQNDTTNYVTSKVYKDGQKENKRFQSYQLPSKNTIHTKKQKQVDEQDLKSIDQNKVGSEKVNKEIKESINKKQLKSSLLLDQEKQKMDEQLY